MTYVHTNTSESKEVATGLSSMGWVVTRESVVRTDADIKRTGMYLPRLSLVTTQLMLRCRGFPLTVTLTWTMY